MTVLELSNEELYAIRGALSDKLHLIGSELNQIKDKDYKEYLERRQSELHSIAEKINSYLFFSKVN